MLEKKDDNDNIISFDIDAKKENLLPNQKDINQPKKFSNNNKPESNKSSFLNNFGKIFLNIGTKKKEKHKRKMSDDYYNIKLLNDDLMNKDNDSKKQTNDDIKDDSDSNSIASIEFDESEIIKTSGLDKFKSIVKKVLRKKKSKDWNEFIKLCQKKIKEKISLQYKLKTIFNINSDFMVIWKLAFSAFSIVFVFIYFFKYILMDLSKKEDENELETSKKVLFLYSMINMMFSFELILSVLIIIFNSGSIMTFIKLPLKIYTTIPFQLKKKNMYLLVPKFFRIDLFEKLFSLIESFINANIAHYVQNYYLRIFITYTIDMFKYLLVFGFYAHCLCSLLCYFYGEDNMAHLDYVSGLYYTIQTFTTIGFGEISPNNVKSLLVMIFTLFLGVNFMSVMTSNIRYLSDKMKLFSRETSFNEQFEVLVFRIQNSTGKVFPSRLKKLMSLFLLFRRGLVYSEIKHNNKRLFDICRDKIVKKIHKKLFNYLKNDFNAYFNGCENEFIFTIFEFMKPKMFKVNKTIIEYNTNVKELYFLISGNIFIYNQYNEPVYGIQDNNLFGEYEFISNSKTNYSVKVHPKVAAYGFVLKQNDWEKISKKYIISAKKFVETIKLRNAKHNEWILYSIKLSKEKNKKEKKNEFEIDMKKSDEIKDYRDSIVPGNEVNLNIGAINDSISLRYDEDNENKNTNIIKKNITTLAKRKSKNYDFNNEDLFVNINENAQELKNIENDLFIFKNDLLRNMRLKKF